MEEEFIKAVLVSYILILILTIIIFLLIREFLCWYWKINKRIDLQENLLKNQIYTNDLLETLIEQNNNIKSKKYTIIKDEEEKDHNDNVHKKNYSSIEKKDLEFWICPKCSKKNNLSDSICNSCNYSII